MIGAYVGTEFQTPQEVHDYAHDARGWGDPAIVPNWSGTATCLGVPNYTASIDAAMTLVPEGMTWFVSTDFVPVSAGVYNGADDDDGLPAFTGDAKTPALALCAAALRAKAA
jgi:hypothetical protein